MRILGSIVVFVAVLLVAGSSVVAASHPHHRQGWVFGMGAGGGSAQIKTSVGSSERLAGAGILVRFGYAFTEQLSLELDMNTWIRGEQEDGRRLTFGIAAAALNFYPGGTGFVARAGVGLGRTDVSHPFRGTYVTAGLGYTVGAGYEFRVGRELAIGPQVDYTWTRHDSFDTNHLLVSVGATWYFGPD